MTKWDCKKEVVEGLWESTIQFPQPKQIERMKKDNATFKYILLNEYDYFNSFTINNPPKIELGYKDMVKVKKDGGEFIHYIEYQLNTKYKIYTDNEIVGEVKNKEGCFNLINISPEVQKAFARKIEQFPSNMVNGYATSFYEDTEVGGILHKCKYLNGGDTPKSLSGLMVEILRKKLNIDYDVIMYAPPSVSGNLVKNLSKDIGDILNIPISDDLYKTNITEQKFTKDNNKRIENVKGNFGCKNPQSIKDKKILLIDDVCGSGATLKSIGETLTIYGAKIIVPLVLTKTRRDKIIEISI